MCIFSFTTPTGVVRGSETEMLIALAHALDPSRFYWDGQVDRTGTDMLALLCEELGCGVDIRFTESLDRSAEYALFESVVAH